MVPRGAAHGTRHGPAPAARHGRLAALPDGWVRTRRRARLVSCLFPHPPRLEPDLRLSPHPAQHFQISLCLSSVACCAYWLEVLHAITFHCVFEPCAWFGSMIYFDLALVEFCSTYVACGALEENDFFSYVTPTVPALVSAP